MASSAAAAAASNRDYVDINLDSDEERDEFTAALQRHNLPVQHVQSLHHKLREAEKERRRRRADPMDEDVPAAAPAAAVSREPSAEEMEAALAADVDMPVGDFPVISRERLAYSDQDYGCAVCLNVVRRATGWTCGHVICHDCVQDMAANGMHSCPSRCPDKQKPTPQHGIDARIRNCWVTCPYPRCGASYVLGMELRCDAAHRQLCKFRPVRCTLGCGHVMRREKEAEHKAQCPNRKEPCPLCNEAVLVTEQAAHTSGFEAGTCAGFVKCPAGCMHLDRRDDLSKKRRKIMLKLAEECKFGEKHKTDGAHVDVADVRPVMILRRDLAEHLRTDCPNADVKCEVCGETYERRNEEDHYARSRVKHDKACMAAAKKKQQQSKPVTFPPAGFRRVATYLFTVPYRHIHADGAPVPALQSDPPTFKGTARKTLRTGAQFKFSLTTVPRHGKVQLAVVRVPDRIAVLPAPTGYAMRLSLLRTFGPADDLADGDRGFNTVMAPHASIRVQTVLHPQSKQDTTTLNGIQFAAFGKGPSFLNATNEYGLYFELFQL